MCDLSHPYQEVKGRTTVYIYSLAPGLCEFSAFCYKIVRKALDHLEIGHHIGSYIDGIRLIMQDLQEAASTIVLTLMRGLSGERLED